MAEEIGNSELVRTWASDGTIVVPSGAKIDEGWLRGEQPPHEWMNYIHNVLGQKVNHVLSRGAADWDNDTEYLAGATVNRDGDLWLSLATNTNNEPSDANSNWYRITAHDKDLRINGIFFGRGAGVGEDNTAISRVALSSNVSGERNTAVGAVTLLENTTGDNNTALGFRALRDNTTGSKNAAVGREALLGNTTGANNSAIGYLSLSANTAGDNNIGLGFRAGLSDSPFTVTSESDRIVLGNNSHTNAYIKVSWTVTSDARDKTELGPVPYGLDFVNALQPTEFQFKAGGRDGVADGIKRYGFLAQDVLTLEGENPVLVDDEDADSLKLKESQLIPVLVQAIQELTARVAELENNNG